MSITSGVSGAANDIRGNYMTLLVTQLQHQNPLEPMSNDDMASQLAQLSQLEHLESLDTTFQKALFSARVNEATGIIGKEVTFFPEDADEAVTGRVESVNMLDGEVLVKVGEHAVALDRILSITNLGRNNNIRP